MYSLVLLIKALWLLSDWVLVLRLFCGKTQVSGSFRPLLPPSDRLEHRPEGSVALIVLFRGFSALRILSRDSIL